MGADVTLKPEQLPELLATVAAVFGGQSEDGGSYGFEVKETWLQGTRLIVHGSSCRKRGPAERDSAVQVCLTEFIACDWITATPALARMGNTLRWHDCDARKPDSRREQARRACSRGGAPCMGRCYRFHAAAQRRGGGARLPVLTAGEG